MIHVIHVILVFVFHSPCDHLYCSLTAQAKEAREAADRVVAEQQAEAARQRAARNRQAEMDKAAPFEDGTPAWAGKSGSDSGSRFLADVLAGFLPNITDLSRVNGDSKGGGEGNSSGRVGWRRRRSRVFYAVFAGRRHLLAVHFKYTNLLLRLRLVSEVHLWDFCRCGIACWGIRAHCKKTGCLASGSSYRPDQVVIPLVFVVL